MLFFMSPAWAQVSGTVKDQNTGAPISGALVGLQAASIRTTTAPDGTFNLGNATGVDIRIVGAKKGFYNRSVIVTAPASGVEVLLDPVLQSDDPDYELVEPAFCGVCHPNQFLQWTDSPMAKAGVNSWVYDIYSGDGTPGGMGGFVYLRDSGHAAANPESECAACHQPEPWIASPFSAIDSVGQISAGAMHGVSCEVCHKIAHLDESKPNYPGIYPSIVTFTRPDSASLQVQYGVLGDSDFDLFPFEMLPSFQPQLKAEVCAACHQDKNDPDGDGNFEEENGVISEPTYLEWLASPYADTSSGYYATCVDCHMPSYGATTVCQVGGYNPPVRDPETIRHHRIEGTTPEFLENAVTLSLNAAVVGNTIEAEVLITNDQTGHHVPDGVTIRNMILLVEARRVNDGLQLTHTGTQVVHELGGVGDPAQGYYAGLPGRFFAKVNHDSSGNGPTFFTDATGIQWDNRIAAFATDSSYYTFDIPDPQDDYQVLARLIYRRSFRFLVDAKGWTEDGHGNPLADALPPYYGHLMEEEEWLSAPAAIAGSDLSPKRFQLLQNFPNPFNPATTISYRLEKKTKVVLKIYSILGEEVITLVNERVGAGLNSIIWDGKDGSGRIVSSGVYVYQLQAGPKAASKKMLFLK